MWTTQFIHIFTERKNNCLNLIFWTEVAGFYLDTVTEYSKIAPDFTFTVTCDIIEFRLTWSKYFISVELVFMDCETMTTMLFNHATTNFNFAYVLLVLYRKTSRKTVYLHCLSIYEMLEIVSDCFPTAKN